MSKSHLVRGTLVALLLAPSVVGGPPARATDMAFSSASSLAAACNAWREHISDLIDQHRIAHEIDDDALFAFILQFIAARDACSLGGYETGLRKYEGIQLGRVQQRPLQ
jgi:hypothetical protein